MTTHEEGFWFRYVGDSLPHPKDKVGEFASREEFLAQLCEVECNLEGTLVGNIVAYRGSSLCRVCQCINGSQEMSLVTATEGCWVWPSGYAHYIREHGVVPSEGFQAAIREAYKELHP